MVTTPAFLSTETTFTMLLLVTLLAFMRLVESPSLGRGLAVGALAGVGALVRSDFNAIPWVVALYLWHRSPGVDRRRAALAFVLVATALPVTWEARERIVAGAPVESYLARGLARASIPGLVYGPSARGYAMMADPAFPEFSHSVTGTIAEAWRRARADPWPHLRWYLVDRWLTLWEFHMIQSPPIHIYPVRHGLFRPAFINPAGTDEPLAPVYWLFRALYWIVVPLVLAGAVLVVRARRATVDARAARGRAALRDPGLPRRPPQHRDPRAPLHAPHAADPLPARARDGGRPPRTDPGARHDVRPGPQRRVGDRRRPGARRARGRGRARRRARSPPVVVQDAR